MGYQLHKALSQNNVNGIAKNAILEYQLGQMGWDGMGWDGIGFIGHVSHIVQHEICVEKCYILQPLLLSILSTVESDC